MRAITAIAVLVLSVCLAQQANAWLYGGWGYGLGLGMYGMYGMGLGWGWPYFRYFRSTMSDGNIHDRISCRYFDKTSMLSCSGPTGLVECAAVANFTGLGDEHKFELFGIANIEGWNGKNVAEEFYRYSMYPRSMDNKIWYNNTMHIGDHDISFGMFHSYTYDYYGYRISDLGCFERFISLFKDAKSDEVIEVNGVAPHFNVHLFGEVLYVKQ
jgi:hypothetical protein